MVTQRGPWRAGLTCLLYFSISGNLWTYNFYFWVILHIYYIWLGVTCTHKNQTLTFDIPSEAPFQCVELMIVMAVCTQAQ